MGAAGLEKTYARFNLVSTIRMLAVEERLYRCLVPSFGHRWFRCITDHPSLITKLDHMGRDIAWKQSDQMLQMTWTTLFKHV